MTRMSLAKAIKKQADYDLHWAQHTIMAKYQFLWKKTRANYLNLKLLNGTMLYSDQQLWFKPCQLNSICQPLKPIRNSAVEKVDNERWQNVFNGNDQTKRPLFKVVFYYIWSCLFEWSPCSTYQKAKMVGKLFHCKLSQTTLAFVWNQPSIKAKGSILVWLNF